MIEVERKLVSNLIGKGSRVLSSNGLIPKGEMLIVGGGNWALHF